MRKIMGMWIIWVAFTVFIILLMGHELNKKEKTMLSLGIISFFSVLLLGVCLLVGLN